MSPSTAVRVAKLAVLLLTLQAAAASSGNLSATFDYTGGFAKGIYNSAKYYASHKINITQYTNDLTDTIRSTSGGGETAGYGFGSATSQALKDSNFRACVYVNAGAIAFDPTPNGAEGADGQTYIANGFDQATSSDANASVAARGVLAAGKAIDGQFGSHIVANALDVYGHYLYENGVPMTDIVQLG